MPVWESSAPSLYSIVTGFFPETSPRQTWAENPRPLLCCGVARDDENSTYFVRVAFGTTQNINRAHSTDLVIGNISSLNMLGLMKPTRFVINSGSRMAILPWTEEFFRPWSRPRMVSPILSRLPEDMRRYVGNVLGRLTDLPQF